MGASLARRSGTIYTYKGSKDICCNRKITKFKFSKRNYGIKKVTFTRGPAEFWERCCCRY